MAEKTIAEKEAQYNLELKQVSLDQEVKDKEIRKQERRMNDFQELESVEQRFYNEVAYLQLDDKTNGFLEQAIEESRWFAREEQEYLEESKETLYQEKRLLLEKEDQLFAERKKIFDIGRSNSIWD
ncbi:hypothetical protein GIX45_26245 [Erwinia sp. CPCC 100877]|nr:hypothetical protein [Erwinia sp. CPCC 100877]